MIFRPIYLVKLQRGNEIWRYAHSYEYFTFDGADYLPTAINGGAFDLSSEKVKSEMTLTFHKTNPFASEYLTFTPDQPTAVWMYEVNREDPSEYIVRWAGTVISGERTTSGEMSFSCESLASIGGAQGLTDRCEVACNKALYSDECGVDREAYAQTVTITAISGTNISVSGSLEDTYRAGILKIQSGAMRMITAQSANVLRISRTFAEELFVGDAVVIYKGCDRSIETCETRFTNHENYGGVPYFAGRNPFVGNPFN